MIGRTNDDTLRRYLRDVNCALTRYESWFPPLASVGYRSEYPSESQAEEEQTHYSRPVVEPDEPGAVVGDFQCTDRLRDDTTTPATATALGPFHLLAVVESATEPVGEAGHGLDGSALAFDGFAVDGFDARTAPDRLECFTDRIGEIRVRPSGIILPPKSKV